MRKLLTPSTWMKKLITSWTRWNKNNSCTARSTIPPGRPSTNWKGSSPFLFPTLGRRNFPLRKRTTTRSLSRRSRPKGSASRSRWGCRARRNWISNPARWLCSNNTDWYSCFAYSYLNAPEDHIELGGTLRLHRLQKQPRPRRYLSPTQPSPNSWTSSSSKTHKISRPSPIRPPPSSQQSPPRPKSDPKARPTPWQFWQLTPWSAIYTATQKTDNLSNPTAHLSTDGCPLRRWAWTTAMFPSGRGNWFPRWSPPWLILRPSSKDWNLQCKKARARRNPKGTCRGCCKR